MAQGTVKWFNDDKGYGFITPDEGGSDLFVHHSGIAGNGFKSLEEGNKVSYEATQGQKGMQANNGRSFDSGRLGKGQRYTHTFKRTGKKPYHCEIHPHMKGRITVKR